MTWGVGTTKLMVGKKYYLRLPNFTIDNYGKTNVIYGLQELTMKPCLVTRSKSHTKTNFLGGFVV